MPPRWKRSWARPAAAVAQFLARSGRAYDATAGTFLHKSLHKAGTYFSPETLKAVAALPGAGPARHHAPAPRQGLRRPAPGAALRPLRHLQRFRPIPGPRHAEHDSAPRARHRRRSTRRAASTPSPQACTAWPKNSG
ncbi:MAG: hypothetical protein WKG07_24110 [Hymenobacter sp.]